MPVGSFDRPTYVADSATAQHDLYFAPDSAALAPGQVEALRSFLGSLVLGVGDDVILNVGRTETPVLNAQRLATLHRAMAQVATPARVRFVSPPGFVNSDSRSDVVLVQVQRYNRIKVVCPSLQVPGELATPLPPMTACANGFNIAAMAADPRDLIAPGRLDGSDDGAVAAVQRYRADKVKPFVNSIDTSN